MKTYYLKLNVVPCETNEHYEEVEGALACCLILANDPDSAYQKSKFYVEKGDWEIMSIELDPIETTRDNFINRDMGLEYYDKAQMKGIAIVYAGWSRDGKTKKGPIKLKSSYDFDLSQYIKELKKNKTRGRCLHYDAGVRCNEFIKAHSIQNKGLLSKIAKDGEVYGLASDIGNLKRNKGKASYEKKGINRISTFLGFCQKHDCELFKPIDNSPLIPIDQQAFLYGYRSLCRELFVKGNSLITIKNQIEQGIQQKAIKNLFTGMEQGTCFGLKNLKAHKLKYDNSLRANQYQNIKYVVFTSNQKPTIVFSGLMYPDYDFIGRPLQNLYDLDTDRELITFCSAPMKTGWGFLFAWHEGSSKVCEEFMRSLATAVYEKGSIEDFLFRLVINNCENLAISPLWWENIAIEHKTAIIEIISETIDIFEKIPNSYLTRGLEGITDWKFDQVISNY